MSRHNGNTSKKAKGQHKQFFTIDVGGKKFQILPDNRTIKPTSKKRLGENDYISLLRKAGNMGISEVQIGKCKKISLADFCKVDTFANAWFIYLKSRNFYGFFAFLNFYCIIYFELLIFNLEKEIKWKILHSQ